MRKPADKESCFYYMYRNLDKHNVMMIVSADRANYIISLYCIFDKMKPMLFSVFRIIECLPSYWWYFIVIDPVVEEYANKS